MAEWTKAPGRGAYWFQYKGYEPDIVWVYGGTVMDACGIRSYVKSDVAAGAMFYGPLDHPPPPPKEEKKT